MYQGLVFQPRPIRIGMARIAGRVGRKVVGGSLRLQSVPEPEWLPGQAPWATLAPIMSGICGSDLALLFGRSSPYLAPLASFPAALGHEVVARVVHNAGQLAAGERVVVDPSLGCQARGYDHLCPECAANHPESCRRRGDRETGPGLLLGYHRFWPGGWATRIWAPAAQCWPIPATLPTPRAVFAEPLATVLSGISRLHLGGGERVAVIGAGTLGLLAIWVLHVDGVARLIHVGARYPKQAQWAKRVGGVPLDAAAFEGAASREIVGAALPAIFGAPPYYPAGYDAVVDAVGTPASVRTALSIVRPGGKILLLGGAGPMVLDLTPLWSRRATWIGAFGYRTDEGSSLFPQAIRMLAETHIPWEHLVIHRFSLPSFREAIGILARHDAHMKAVFLPGEPDGHAVPCRMHSPRSRAYDGP